MNALRWIAAATVALQAAAAQAYVRTRTESNAAVKWVSPCVPLVVHTGNPPPNLTTTLFLQASQAAAEAWSNGPMLTCSGLSLTVTTSLTSSSDARDDRANHVTFRRQRWCHEPADPKIGCYDPAALAITTVTARKDDGEIVDTDVEVNAVNFIWDDLVMNPDAKLTAQDLQNTLTHEFGHVIGIDHNCYVGGPGARPMDHSNQPAPDCIGSSMQVMQQTMYAAVVRGDTTRRTLGDDDKKAVCDVYPSSMGMAGTCMPPGPPDDGGGCRIVPASRRSASAFAAVVVGVALGFRAQRRRRSRS